MGSTRNHCWVWIGVLDCNTICGGRCGESIYKRKRGDKAWRPISERLCVGLCACRNTFLLQWVLLCLWLVDIVVHSQCGGDSACACSVGVSGIDYVSRNALSNGYGNQCWFAPVGDNMCSCLRVAYSPKEIGKVCLKDIDTKKCPMKSRAFSVYKGL